MPTLEQTNIILESEFEFKTFKAEPMSNTQLPAEVVDNIKSKAKSLSGHSPDEDSTPFRNGMYSGYITGATEYAPYKVKYETARALLEKFISLHEADRMSWEFITEIKTFLNGTK
jgi:hypothetical protein